MYWDRFMHFNSWISSLVALSALSHPSFAADDPIETVKHELAGKLDRPESFEALDNGAAGTVVSLTALFDLPEGTPSGEEKRRNNLYVYLSRDGGAWKIIGTRGSATEELTLQALLFGTKRHEDIADATGLSLEQVRRLSATMQLAASTDDILMRHFQQNKDTFEKIRGQLDLVPPNDQYRFTPTTEQAADFDAVHILYGDRGVLPDDLSDEGGCSEWKCYTFTVAFTPPQFKVGYFYLTGAAKPPAMTAREYLVVRSLGDGWYFFRQN